MPKWRKSRTFQCVGVLKCAFFKVLSEKCPFVWERKNLLRGGKKMTISCWKVPFFKLKSALFLRKVPFRLREKRPTGRICFAFFRWKVPFFKLKRALFPHWKVPFFQSWKVSFLKLKNAPFPDEKRPFSKLKSAPFQGVFVFFCFVTKARKRVLKPSRKKGGLKPLQAPTPVATPACRPLCIAWVSCCISPRVHTDKNNTVEYL